MATHTHTHTHTYIYIYRERERERETCWPRWAAKLWFIYMFDIEPNKPGSSTDIIMGIGTENRSAYSIDLDLVLAS